MNDHALDKSPGDDVLAGRRRVNAAFLVRKPNAKVIHGENTIEPVDVRQFIRKV